jgi:hypothetical protein
MINPQPVVVSDVSSVRQELSVLGLTPEGVRDIARQAAAAKAEALAVDPCSTPGTLAYIYGVRAIRLQLIPEGWRISRSGNVESTVNDDLGIQLVFQNVDLACDARDPQAISGKGAGSRKLIEFGKQGELFERLSTPEIQATPVAQALGVVPTVWVLCVSTEGKHLRAEVSCPDVFEGNQFEGFSKRIFVVDEDFGPNVYENLPLDNDGGDGAVEVRIAKK